MDGGVERRLLMCTRRHPGSYRAAPRCHFERALACFSSSCLSQVVRRSLSHLLGRAAAVALRSCTSQAYLLRTPTTVISDRDTRSTRPCGQRLKCNSDKAACARPQALAAGGGLGKVLAVRSSHGNASEVHRNTAFVAYCDLLGKALGAAWLIAEVQACG